MRTIDKVVIHHTAVIQPNLNTLITSVNRTHKERLHPETNDLGYHIAYHYIIGVDGTVVQTRGLHETGYHASNLPVNQTSVGIGLSGDFDRQEPTDAQYQACMDLINTLEKQIGNALSIHKHNEYANKTCPGTLFQFYKLYHSLMLFYEKLRRDNFSNVPREQRMFKNPDGFIERTKDLNLEERLSEMTFLIAIIAEKLGKRDAELRS